MSDRGAARQEKADEKAAGRGMHLNGPALGSKRTKALAWALAFVALASSVETGISSVVIDKAELHPTLIFESVNERDLQRLAQQIDGPRANERGHNAEYGHEPLRSRIANSDPGYPAKEGLIRIILFAVSGVLIMIGAGKFSARDWGENPLRFYGGLVGGLILCGLAGFFLIFWPLI